MSSPLCTAGPVCHLDGVERACRMARATGEGASISDGDGGPHPLPLAVPSAPECRCTVSLCPCFRFRFVERRSRILTGGMTQRAGRPTGRTSVETASPAPVQGPRSTPRSDWCRGRVFCFPPSPRLRAAAAWSGPCCLVKLSLLSPPLPTTLANDMSPSRASSVPTQGDRRGRPYS